MNRPIFPSPFQTSHYLTSSMNSSPYKTGDQIKLAILKTSSSPMALLLLLFIGVAIPMTANCNSEGDALHAQRIALSDPNNVLQSWDPTLVNPCTWFHVTCNNDNSVIRVDLGNAGLSGSLVPQLGQLANLQYLELYSNNLTGKIPTELGNLTSLVSLGLQNNVLSGVIPTTLGFLVNLRFLDLSENNLTGEIPSSFGNLTSLQRLELKNNFLTGSIPAELGNIRSLQYLRLNGNSLTGRVPTRVVTLVITGNLIEMNISGNRFSGTGKSKIRVTTIIQDS